jgi:glycosyltransferase involved in cell wall biosynthesis
LEPALTIAIPHYRHRAHLEVVLASVMEQTADDIEVIVADDASGDDSADVIPALLRKGGRPFRYFLHPSNLGYDANVRFCLAAATGRYVLLLGNDDALNGSHVAAQIIAGLERLGQPQVALTNWRAWPDGKTSRRATVTARLGSGSVVALRHFRSFSFVSGLVFERMAANAHATDMWDRSIYYQIWLGARIVASGGELAALDVVAVAKDVRVDGQTVETYASRLASSPWSLSSRHTGLDAVIAVAVDAIAPHWHESRSSLVRRVTNQVLVFSYAHWLLEYRRLANWSAGLGVARGMVPSRLPHRGAMNPIDHAWTSLVYGAVTLAGLSAPTRLLMPARRLAERFRHSAQRV